MRAPVTPDESSVAHAAAEHAAEAARSYFMAELRKESEPKLWLDARDAAISAIDNWVASKPRPGDVYDWIEYGVAQGWCSPTACSTHDGTPYTDAEGEDMEAGGDPCIHIVRLYHPE